MTVAMTTRALVSFVTGLVLVAALFVSPLTAGVASAAPSAQLDNAAAVDAYAHVLQKINPQLRSGESHWLATHVLTNASRWRIDANLLVALVTVESAWRTQARSHVGAIGLGQLMPGTAALLGVNPRNPYQNLSGSARYLGGLIAKYHGKPRQYELAFAAYNAGPKAVARFGGVPPYSETQHYVVKVMRTWNHIRSVVRIPDEVLAQREPRAKAPVIDWSAVQVDEAYWGSGAH